MVNLLVTYGTNALTIIVLIIFNNFLTKLSRSAVNKINCTNFTQHRKDIKYLNHSITAYPTVFICTLTSLYLLWILFMLLLCGDIEVNPGPYEHTITSDDSVDSIPNSLDLILENSISIAHLNVQSINNKLDIIQAELGGFDIITLNETWLDKNTSSQDILLQGFQEPFRRDREENRYGGVIIYAKNHISCKRRQDLEVQQIECIWIECFIYKIKFLIGTFYRPPNSESSK